MQVVIARDTDTTETHTRHRLLDNYRINPI